MTVDLNGSDSWYIKFLIAQSEFKASGSYGEFVSAHNISTPPSLIKA